MPVGRRRDGGRNTVTKKATICYIKIYAPFSGADRTALGLVNYIVVMGRLLWYNGNPVVFGELQWRQAG